MTATLKLVEKVEAFQNLLLAQSTGGVASDEEYVALRKELLTEPLVSSRLPHFVKTCRDLFQFWTFIKHEYGSYQRRRDYLWAEFRPILEMLESGTTPADPSVSEVLSKFDVEHVHKVWTTARNRRDEDPEGAITSARTLLETVCKNILAYSQNRQTWAR